MQDEYVNVAVCFGQFQCDKCANWFSVEGTDYEGAAQIAESTGWEVAVRDNTHWDIFCPECARKG